MKLYTFFFLFSCITGVSTTYCLTGNSTMHALQQKYCGSSLAPLTDYRVAALLAVGVISTTIGSIIIAKLFSDDEKIKKIGLLQKIYSYLGAHFFILGGIMNITCARLIISAIDELTYKGLYEFHKNKGSHD